MQVDGFLIQCLEDETNRVVLLGADFFDVCFGRNGPGHYLPGKSTYLLRHFYFYFGAISRYWFESQGPSLDQMR